MSLLTPRDLGRGYCTTEFDVDLDQCAILAVTPGEGCRTSLLAVATADDGGQGPLTLLQAGHRAPAKWLMIRWQN
jgi:hypothetical protein